MASHKHRKQPGTGPPTWRCKECGKVAYATWSHANWDARNQRNRYRRRRRERPYWSRDCHAFHVGSRNPRKATP